MPSPAMSTPSARLPEMTLPAPEDPPIVLFVAPFWMITPEAPLPRACMPEESVPIESPSTTLPVVPASEM